MVGTGREGDVGGGMGREGRDWERGRCRGGRGRGWKGRDGERGRCSFGTGRER